MQNGSLTHDGVKEYYGKVLSKTSDLKTSACCLSSDIPSNIKEILGQIDDEILSKFYGCGSPIPEALEGKVVLDLGCGSGRDVYVLSKLVGESGKVIGIDMTEEQLSVARKHADAQAKAFGFSKSNVEFHQGYIEDLAAIGIADNSVDVVVSNCVINLSPDKDKVLSEIFRVLKPGGELYFSDVFSGRRIPQELREDPVLYGECLSGALYVEDFRRILLGLGCADFRQVEQSPITVEDEALAAKVGLIPFWSITVRAFKLETLEDICEDYGQVATYKGTIQGNPNFFCLDDHHLFEKGLPLRVCGNTASMLQETRFSQHFDITGDRSIHFGPFDGCGEVVVSNESSPSPAACC
jgi:SAM-dependent methyltransferase